MVIEIVNSFVGKAGNIGVRTAKILEHLSKQDDARDNVCICRGVTLRSAGVQYDAMGAFGHVGRLLNAIRLYLAPRFNQRPLDILLFEKFAISKLRQCCIAPGTVAHLWETAPKLIVELKNSGIPVILDIPIAPTAYAERLWREQGVGVLVRDPRLIALERAAIELADTLLVPSSFVGNELRRLGVADEKIAVVEFGVDTILELSVKTPVKYGAINYGFVGNVNRRKGVVELLKVWERGEFRGDRLHLCGRVFTEVRPYLGRAASGVMTLGFVNPQEYLKKCDVFVLPSWMEGSAKAVYEAMAMGLPAIVTESTGSIIRDGVDGFVIEAGDTDALADRMLWFKNNPEQIAIMGKSAWMRVQDYTWQRYAIAVSKVYQKWTH